MKKIILAGAILTSLILCFSFFMMKPSYTFDSLYGWWHLKEKARDKPDLILINKETFFGFPYKIMKESGSEMQISLDNYKEPTIIQIDKEDNITLTTVQGYVMSYARVTKDTNLTKKEIKKLIGE